MRSGSHLLNARATDLIFRLSHWLRWLALTLCLAASAASCAAQDRIGQPTALHSQFGPGDGVGGVRLLGAVRLLDNKINGLRLCGLSGLAWDEAAGLLYAVSDQAYLFHLRPEFDAHGYLVGIQAVAAYRLRDAAGTPLRHPWRDAEDVALRHRPGQPPELLIPFERKPRLVRYTVQGHWRGEIALPAPWRTVRRYRDPNRGLEALALSSKWDWLLGTELPLRADPDLQIRLFTRGGQVWRYPLSNAPGSALVAMTALPDGGLLTLERAFVHPLRPLSILLRRTGPLPAPTAGPLLTVTEVARFDNSQGWLLDNFEGLTAHRPHHFFMVSDDNCSRWQSTLLVYLALTATPSRIPTP